MLCVDVNVLVSAFRAGSPHHGPAYGWLDAAQRGPEPVIVFAEVVAAATRILTNPQIWPSPSDPEEVLQAIEDLLASPVVSLMEAPPRRWPIFTELVTGQQLRGNDIPDALLAASVLALGAALVTFDRGFTRFAALELALL